MSLLTAAMLGLGLGLKHALEADHVAAVCALVTRERGVARAARFGALWGVGHGAAIVVAGGALVATGLRVPGAVASALDVAVAVMLVALGVAALRSPRAHHAHAHPHGPSRRPLWVGLLHGASGTAALTLLVTTTIPGRVEALAFVALFGVASVIGMAAAAALLALPLGAAAERLPSLARALRGAAGLGSIAAGFLMAWMTLAPGAAAQPG